MRELGKYFLLLFLLAISCTRNPIRPKYIEAPHMAIQALPFEVQALSSQKLKMIIPTANSIGNYQKGNIYLMRNGDTLATGALSYDPKSIEVKTTLNYEFDNHPYELKVDLQKVNGDTIYTYQISSYTYKYRHKIQTEPLISFRNFMGSYDLSPDERYLFWSEYSPTANHSSFTLYRYDRQTGKKELLNEDFNGWQLVRALSDSELVTYVQKFNGQTLPDNDAALVTYNIENHSEKLITHVNSNYARFSRIIGDHMIAGTRLINLKSYTIKPLNINNTSVDEYMRHFLGVGNQQYDLSNEKFQPVNKQLPNNSNILAYTPSEQTTIAAEWPTDNHPYAPPSEYRLLVLGPNAQKFVEKEYQQKSIRWAVYQPEHQRVIFYQSFSPGLSPNPSGIYELNLQTQKIQLIDDAENTRQAGPHVLYTKDGKIIGMDSNGFFEIITDN